MIRVRQVEISVSHNTEENIIKKCAYKLNINKEEIKKIKINKQSIDARKKPNIFYIYEVDIEVDNEDEILSKFKSNDILKTPIEKYQLNINGTKKLNKKIVIVGAGPAGLFCAYLLSESGYQVIVIERGEQVEDRIKTVEEFWNNNILNENSNVQFGEGGAGTFSDGKLNTMVKDPLFRQKKIFQVFVECGAPEEILYLNKPHIGTDILRTVVINMRNKIIEMGGVFKYNTCLTNINIENDKIKSIEINNKEIIETDILVLALGHSARDTFKMLHENKIFMEPKPFAMGIRIEHPQDMINNSQYGTASMPPASYKLTYKASNNRGVYTFCMCPGGYVVNSSSEDGRLAVNGMSNHARDTKNANSAIIVTVTPEDFGTSPLDGIEFQRKLEEKAYKIGNGKIPVQLYKDFKNNVVSTNFENVDPIFKGDYKLSNIRDILPNYMVNSLIEGIDYFGKKIKGYNRDDAILAAIESRTSSPIKILRDEFLESNIKGIYPCGEGAGYAGGITSAAMDGIKVAEAIASIYIN